MSKDISKKMDLFCKQISHHTLRILAYDAIKKGITLQVIDSKLRIVLFRKGNVEWIIHKCTLPVNSIMGKYIADNKYVTNVILKKFHFPCPVQYMAESEKEVMQYVKILKKCVIKPLSNYGGKGITINPQSPQDIRLAFKHAKAYSKNNNQIIVEQFFNGNEYRVLVVGNSVVAVTLREKPFVIGDGQSTIRQLIVQENRSRDKMQEYAKFDSKDFAPTCFPIAIDNELKACLREQGLNFLSIIQKGKKIFVRRNSNISTGGMSVDKTSEIHPLIAQSCVNAVKKVGLEISGVDVITRDISTPFKKDEGIIEVNARPGIRLHAFPVQGDPVDVGHSINTYMYRRFKKLNKI